MNCFVILLIHAVFVRSLPVGEFNRLPRQDLIGGWIQSSEWFPIEINVPDTISNTGQGISSGFMNLTNTLGSWIQGLPAFNRVPSQFKPRPFKFFVLVPVGNRKKPSFDPFDDTFSHFVPVYP